MSPERRWLAGIEVKRKKESMRILSFDTTNNCVSIALLEREKLVSERLFVATGSERQESVTLLLPAVDEMLQQSGWKKSDLDLLVVGIGPGSFTGIRIAVVTARTLAQALKLPLTGVSLLDCFAAKLSASKSGLSEFAVVLSGGRGHFYFAAYRTESAHAQAPAGQGAVCGLTAKEIVKPQHGTLPEMQTALSALKTWAVDPSLVQSLSESALALVAELPKLDNIAAFQGVLAWRRVALSKSRGANLLASFGVSEENGRDAKEMRESLLIDYPYNVIEPLYLRGASVTLKGSDGKATATT